MFVPTKCFFTKGGGHPQRQTGIGLNWPSGRRASRSTIWSTSRVYSPPNCQLVSRDEGLTHLSPGSIVYVVMARNETNEPSRLVSAAIGHAMPKESNTYGYLSEHHAFGRDGRGLGRVRRRPRGNHARHHARHRVRSLTGHGRSGNRSTRPAAGSSARPIPASRRKGSWTAAGQRSSPRQSSSENPGIHLFCTIETQAPAPPWVGVCGVAAPHTIFPADTRFRPLSVVRKSALQAKSVKQNTSRGPHCTQVFNMRLPIRAVTRNPNLLKLSAGYTRSAISEDLRSS